jgi:hypothetical protein
MVLIVPVCQSSVFIAALAFCAFKFYKLNKLYLARAVRRLSIFVLMFICRYACVLMRCIRVLSNCAIEISELAVLCKTAEKIPAATIAIPMRPLFHNIFSGGMFGQTTCSEISLLLAHK